MSLYVHIPFCRSKCVYCDFCSFAAADTQIEGYCASLMREMELAANAYPDAEIETVYFGGGTPSIVSAPLMRQVMRTLRERFAILPGAEFTSEANPGTVTDAWFSVMAEEGMNRLSLGVQAKQERLLQTLGRIHSFPQATEALAMARRHGITNLSVDLMAGLPGQTTGDYLDSITAVADLDVRHISAYTLKVEAGTKLQTMLQNGTAVLPSEDETADIVDAGIVLLERLHYPRYEISNFARFGFESRHNLVYWRQGYYLGLGLNAAGMLPAEGSAYTRYTNVSDISAYRRMIDAGMLPVGEVTPVSRGEAMFETVMLGLRTVKGVGIADFETMHGIPLLSVYRSAVEQLDNKGWLQPVDTASPRLALNNRGLDMQNTALMLFLPNAGERLGEKAHKNNTNN